MEADKYLGLSSYVKNLFEAFKRTRQPWEDLWQELWMNFLGEYNPNTAWRKKTEGRKSMSRAFVKLTSLKCHTAHSKIMDVLFQRGEVPFDCIPVFYEELGLNVEQAKESAYQVRTYLRELFRDIEFEEILDTAILELTILGTTVIKAPIVEMWRRKILRMRTVAGLPVAGIDSEVTPYEAVEVEEPVPVADHIPLWEYYTDINALSNKDAIGEIHFQRLLPDKFRELAYLPGYDPEAVYEAARRATTNEENDKRYIQLSDNYAGEQSEKDARVSVLEFWGRVPASLLREAKVAIPDDIPDEEGVESIVVLAADGIICKAVMNPLGFRPFFVCPYKKKPHVIYGTGVAELMRDAQRIINSAVRMFIDNKALSGPAMLGINLDRIDTRKTRNLDIYPLKPWFIRGNFSPREAIDVIHFQDSSNDLLNMIQLFERFADEETGLPKYTSGQQDSFLNKTATGMSMLMTQANINLRTVIRNIDNYIIEPVVEAFVDWINSVKGPIAQVPVKIRAIGCDSLMAKEIKMENYIKFMQVTAGPQDAIFMDRPKLIRNIARLLDAEDVMRSKEETEAIMAEMTRQAQRGDYKALVDIDRLYPLLTRTEQMQILEALGIIPDMNQPVPVTGQEAKVAVAAMKAAKGGT